LALLGSPGLALWALAVACPGGGRDGVAPTDPTDTGTPCSDSLSDWQTVGQRVLHTWCTPCHSTKIAVELRQGAPVGVNFDTYELVFPWAERIRQRASIRVDMPPSGGVSKADRAALAEWVECGAVGTIVPPILDACDTPSVVSGNVAGEDLSCAEDVGVTVEGSLVLERDADVSCVCAVSGDVRTEGASSVDLTRLVTIGGALSVQGAAIERFEAGALLSAGTVEVSGVAALHTLNLADLRTATEVVIADAPALPEVRLEELAEVTRSVRLEHIGQADPVSLPRLATIGGDYILRDIPRTTVLIATHTTTSIGGSLIIEGLDNLAHVDDFSELLSIGDDLVVRNTGVASMHGFHRLVTVGGSVIVEGNGGLGSAHGLADLVSVGGDFVIQNNALFFEFESLVFLTDVGGDFVIKNHPVLVEVPTFKGLTSIGGDFEFTGNLQMADAVALELAGRANVGGTIIISGNAPP